MSSLGRQFKDVMGQQINEFKADHNDDLKQIAAAGYNALIERSPIWSGSYVLSHRLSVNKMAVAEPTDVRIWDGGRHPVKIDSQTANQYRNKAVSEIGKVHTYMGDIDTVEISNNIEHAIIVEVEKRAPYAVAAQVMRSLAKKLGSKAKITGLRKRS